MAAMAEIPTSKDSVLETVATPCRQTRPEKSRPMAIVLTGGPCSGKSSILALIRDRLSKRGMQVCTVPEYATHFFANSDGFQRDWVGKEEENKLQDILLRFQVTQEDMFHEFANLNTKPSVLLLDRSAIDQKVFVSSSDIWWSALKQNNLTEDELLNRYDLVIHLSTCAKVGDYQWGPGSNNPGRYHTPDEAAQQDLACTEVYKGHKQLRMVPHYSKFADKVEQVMKYLEDALGVDGLAGRRQRATVKVSDYPVDVLQGSQAFVITSTYLDSAMHVSLRRRQRIPVEQWRQVLQIPNRRAWVPSHGDGAHSFEERRSIPDENFLARRVLTETAYHTEAQLAERAGIDKYVLSFQVGAGLHFELFYFQGGGSKLVLDFPVGADLPSWIELDADTEVVPHPAKVAKKESRPWSTCSKPPRILRKNSTEEAAVSFERMRDGVI